MKNCFFKIWLILFGFFAILSCDEQGGRLELNHAEDRLRSNFMRPDFSLIEALLAIPRETATSDSIALCEHGQQIMRLGNKALPQLWELFGDTTETSVYSAHNERNLTAGEIAILLAGKIKSVPIAWVVGVQQCTPPYDDNLEHFLYYINSHPDRFRENYKDWMKENKIN